MSPKRMIWHALQSAPLQDVRRAEAEIVCGETARLRIPQQRCNAAKASF